jgi:acyl-coenzyme A synthetase/AMP-(fatty) acid ligase
VAFESVAAQVVPADGARIDVQDIQQWVASRMAEYAVPRYVRIVDALPRNRTGKIDKRALREALLAELAEKGVAAPTTEGSAR